MTKNRRSSLYFILHLPGFVTGVENMGGGGGVGVALQNLMWGLKSIQWGSMGGALNAVEKTLQACKFSKNELLHTYF